MVNQQLLDYIKQRLEQGADKEELKKSLASTGWQEPDIQSAFGQLEAGENKGGAPQAPVNNPPVNPTPNGTTPPDNLYPQIAIDRIQNPSRFYAFPLIGILVKFIMLFPLFLGLLLIVFIWLPISIINSFIVLFTGKYWRVAYNFNLGIIRIWIKINFFLAGLTNKYPGFSDKINDQFSVELNYPEHPNRLFALPFLGGIVRYVLLIPFFIYAYIIQYAAFLGTFLIAWLPVLVAKKYPESVFDLNRDETRLSSGGIVYMAGLSDKYPSFRISMNHKIKKLFLIVIAIFFLILPNLSTPILNLFFKDIPPIDDSDLQLKVVNIPKEQNAFYDFQEIGKYIGPDPVELKDHLEGKTWDEQFVQETLAKNEQALALFDEAVKKPSFQNPKTADPTKILSNFNNPAYKLNPLSPLRIARLSALKALVLARQGNEIEALNETLKSVEIGQKIQESQANMIDYLVGVAMKERGLGTIQKIIATTKLPPDILIQDIQYLEKFKNNEEGLKTAFKAEYALNINATILAYSIGSGEEEYKTLETLPDITPEMAQRLVRTSFYFQPNKTKAIIASEIRVGIDEINKPCGLAKIVEINMLSPFVSTKSSMIEFPTFFMRDNALGKILHDPLMSGINFSTQNEKRCREDFLVSSTQILFALKAYNLETGGYTPTTLNELVPKYLSKVPEDPFDGKPIRYSPTKKIIYSVGKDRIDSGGSEGEDWTQMPDPTFKIEF